MRKLCSRHLEKRKMSANRLQVTTAPGARRGAQFLARLRESPPNLWYRGEQVMDVTAHPALRGGVATLARLYDLQWERAEETLYTSPTSGRKVAKSFMMPRTHAELRGISAAMKVWHDYTRGLMGRVPDYINRAITGYAAGAAFLVKLIRGLVKMRSVTTSICARTTFA